MVHNPFAKEKRRYTPVRPVSPDKGAPATPWPADQATAAGENRPAQRVELHRPTVSQQVRGSGPSPDGPPAGSAVPVAAPQAAVPFPIAELVPSPTRRKHSQQPRTKSSGKASPSYVYVTPTSSQEGNPEYQEERKQRIHSPKKKNHKQPSAPVPAQAASLVMPAAPRTDRRDDGAAQADYPAWRPPHQTPNTAAARPPCAAAAAAGTTPPPSAPPSAALPPTPATAPARAQSTAPGPAAAPPAHQQAAPRDAAAPATTAVVRRRYRRHSLFSRLFCGKPKRSLLSETLDYVRLDADGKPIVGKKGKANKTMTKSAAMAAAAGPAAKPAASSNPTTLGAAGAGQPRAHFPPPPQHHAERRNTTPPPPPPAATHRETTPSHHTQQRPPAATPHPQQLPPGIAFPPGAVQPYYYHPPGYRGYPYGVHAIPGGAPFGYPAGPMPPPPPPAAPHTGPQVVVSPYRPPPMRESDIRPVHYV